MKLTTPEEGVKCLALKSGINVYIKDDGQICVGKVLISNDEFREIAAIRHAMKN